MFNAVNILEALKNYIHTRGGTSNAYNIAEAVNDLNSIPQGSGSDIPPEVSNAVETHGMGWTDEEVVEGFDITWDGNTEGLESLVNEFFKISDKVYTEDVLIGANGEYTIDDITYQGIVSYHGSSGPMNIYSLEGSGSSEFKAPQAVVVVLEDAEIETPEGVMIFHKGTYFDSPIEGHYTSRLYKEASTEEVVHQIDQKYIPQGQGSAMVVRFELDETTDEVSADKTPSEVLNAMLSESVVGVLTISDSVYPIGSAFASIDSKFIGFYSYHGFDDSPMPIISGSVQSGGWELAQ